MNYININKCDLNNGNGVRVTLWVSGCEFHCEDCHNKSAWNFNVGNKFDKKAMDTLVEYLSDKYVNGLSILGGEPLHDKNIDKVCEICDIVKQLFPNKDIWIWTGYKIEDLKRIPNCDIIIDGLYQKDNPTKKKWRGSDNQRMFHVQNGKYKLIN